MTEFGLRDAVRKSLKERGIETTRCPHCGRDCLVATTTDANPKTWECLCCAATVRETTSNINEPGVKEFLDSIRPNCPQCDTPAENWSTTMSNDLDPNISGQKRTESTCHGCGHEWMDFEVNP